MSANDRQLGALEFVAGTLPQMRWYRGRYRLNIRVDAPFDANDIFEPHAHIHDEAGRELIVVNLDGSARRGVGGCLHADDAATLRLLGYKIPDDRWIR